eukprot:TRINITY_DN4334_c0_g1_i1.p1 TRINITY_DN4334_c0_g1~~TRINITY_DN4334_c0_g1_i1.p1  ORF type:complete len:1370 (-),score=387.10 TRINITY_DN4334_c0_g1_i1:146-4255(-)
MSKRPYKILFVGNNDSAEYKNYLYSLKRDDSANFAQFNPRTPFRVKEELDGSQKEFDIYSVTDANEYKNAGWTSTPIDVVFFIIPASPKGSQELANSDGAEFDGTIRILIGLKVAEKELSLDDGILLASSFGCCSYDVISDKDEFLSNWKKSLLHITYRSQYLGKSKASMNDKQFSNFPGYIASAELVQLDLSKNFITEVGCRQVVTGKFYNLKKLDVSHNNLFFLSPVVGRLKNLQTLDISYNKLTVLPSTLCECSLLEKLIVRNNQLDTLPNTLYLLKNMSRIDLRENPLGLILPEVLPKTKILTQNHISRLAHYLEALEKGTSSQFMRVKVMFVGDANVGKTSLLHCFMHNRPYQDQFNIATDGIDLKQVEVGDINFDCWDFAGQELYYTTHQFFLTTKAIYLMIFNLVDINHKNINYWLKSVRQRAKNAPVILVGTHSDDPRCTEEYVEQVRSDLKKKFRNFHIEGTIFTVSNVTKDKTIKVLKDELVSIAQKRKLIGASIPLSYTYLINKIPTLKTERPFMTVSELSVHMKALNIPDSKHKGVLETLNDLGYVLYNGNDTQLQDLVILDPEFLSNLMKSIVSMKNRWVKDGKLSDENLKKLMSDFPEDTHEKFLRLLSQFEVIYKLNDNEWIVPCMLNATPDDEFKKFDFKVAPLDNDKVLSSRVYDFGFMPFGFFPRLATRIISLEEMETSSIWKNGLLVNSKLGNGQSGGVSYDSDTYTLTLGVLSKPDHKDLNKHLLVRMIEAVDSLIAAFHTGKRSQISIAVPYTIPDRSAKDVLQPNHISLNFTYTEIVEAGITGQKEIKYLKPGSITSATSMSSLAMTTTTTTTTSEDQTNENDSKNSIPLLYVAPDIARLQAMALDNLTKDQKLGEGAFGVVYKGKLNGKTDVAIKELKSSAMSDESSGEGFNEFMHEVNLMTRFDDPYLIKLFGTALNPLCMVMEFCPGKSLDRIIYDKATPNSAIPWRMRIKIALDMARGLRTLHRHKPAIMHRDFRSPNIFINSLEWKGMDFVNAKVGDFGLSQYSLPTLSEMLGCWQWLAPEVFDHASRSYDERSDIYSFGIVLNEIVSREIPFSDYNQYIETSSEALSDEQLSNKELINKLTQSGYVIVGKSAVKEQYKVHEIKSAILEHDLRPTMPESCPARIADLITECWQKNPADRLTIDQIITELEAIMSSDIVNEVFDDSIISPRYQRSLSKMGVKKAKMNRQYHPLMSRIEFLAETEDKLMISIQSINVEKISLCDFFIAPTLFVRIKFHNQIWKTKAVRVDQDNKSWILDEPWEIACNTSSMIPLEIGIQKTFTSTIVSRGIINVLCNFVNKSEEEVQTVQFPLLRIGKFDRLEKDDVVGQVSINVLWKEIVKPN